MNDPMRFFLLALDPVHVGAGGYQLGRVDMSIVREPATGIPKIPGTSLAGAVRAYAEVAKKEKPEDYQTVTIEQIFGSATEDQGRQGMLRFYDGQIVLFPVSSILGTVWISTADRLRQWLGVADLSVQGDRLLIVRGIDSGTSAVNLGWLLMQAQAPSAGLNAVQLPALVGFADRVGVVSAKLFHHVVNDHLEVRTSVSIDPETGAAKRGFLFTYEAVPRGTLLGFELAVDLRRQDGTDMTLVRNLIRRSFECLRVLGVGGMGTRGFGRLEVLNLEALS